MKKIIFILSLLAIVGCSKEDQGCECDIKVIIVDGTLGQTGSYIIQNVPSDCEGNVDFHSLNLPNDHWFYETRNCY